VGAHKRKLSLLFSWIDIIGLLKAEAIWTIDVSGVIIKSSCSINAAASMIDSVLYEVTT